MVKKRYIKIVFILLMIAATVISGTSMPEGKAQAMAGSGTVDDPYLIYDVDDLQDMDLDMSAYYELANDIDCSTKTEWSWTPQVRYPSSDIGSGGVWTVVPGAPPTLWDKVVVPDDDATNINTINNGSWAIFGHPVFSVPATAERITLEVLAWVRNDGTANSALDIEARVNGIDYDGTAAPMFLRSSSYMMYYGVYSVNPNTGLAWTVDDINGVGPNPLQGFGITVTDANPRVYVTQVASIAYSAGFDPVGELGNLFSGHFDGNEHTISNLWIVRRDEEYVGLFGITDDPCGTIQDVTLEDAYIVAKGTVGALIGFHEWQTAADTGVVQNCHATGDIYAYLDLIGGLIGYSGSTVTECTAGVDVHVQNANGLVPIQEIGGFAGMTDRDVSRCYSTGDVITNTPALRTVEQVGGFTGLISDLQVHECFSLGDVTITAINADDVDYIGGFTGDMFSVNGALNCYARGDVTVDATGATGWNHYVGGFVGYNLSTVNCYSTGLITTLNMLDVGGLVGDNGGAVTNSFWDVQTSGTAVSDGGTGETTANMKTEATFTGVGWDFTTIWGMFNHCNDGYPCLLGVTPLCSGGAGPAGCIYIPIISIAIACTTVGGMFKLAFDRQSWQNIIGFMTGMFLLYILVVYNLMPAITPDCPRGWLLW